MKFHLFFKKNDERLDVLRLKLRGWIRFQCLSVRRDTFHKRFVCILYKLFCIGGCWKGFAGFENVSGDIVASQVNFRLAYVWAI